MVWVDAVIQSIQEQCYTKVITDEDQWQDTGTGTPSIPPTIVNNICLNDCSNTGTCVLGK